MPQPAKPVALNLEQIGELNNSLSLIAATVESIRRRPAATEQMWNTLAEQPRKITETISQFSRDLEAALHITRS